MQIDGDVGDGDDGDGDAESYDTYVWTRMRRTTSQWFPCTPGIGSHTHG